MHDVTRESIAPLTDHFTDDFVSENFARICMTLWRCNDVRKFDADAIFFRNQVLEKGYLMFKRRLQRALF